MSLPPVQKYILYCMGFGYFDKRRYDNDMEHERAVNWVLQYKIDQMMKSAQLSMLHPELEHPPELPQLQQLPRPIRVVIQLILNPFQQLAHFVTQIPQALTQAVANLMNPLLESVEATLGKLITFFFGAKKGKTETEKDNRERDDFSETDLFTRFVTHESSPGGQDTPG